MLGLGLAAGGDEKLDEARVQGAVAVPRSLDQGRPKVLTEGGSLEPMLAPAPPARCRAAPAPPRRWLPLMSLVVAQGAYAKPKATQRIQQVPDRASHNIPRRNNIL